MTIHERIVLDHHHLFNSSEVFLYLNANCSEEVSEDNNFERKFGKVTTWIDLIIHLLAMIGNILAVMVLWRQRIGGKRMNQLLLLLTATEIFYTGPSFVSELLDMYVTNWPTTLVYLLVTCRLISHTCLSQRNWWVVVISAIRYLVIGYPLQMKKLTCYSHKGVVILFLMLMTMWVAESIGMIFLFRVVVLTCLDNKIMITLVWGFHGRQPSFKLAEALIVILRTVVPTILVSMFSLMTLYHLYSASAVRRTRLSSATRTILFLTFAFVVFELPFGLTCIFCFISTERGTLASHIASYYTSITSVLVALDSLSNNIIYCVGSRAYRLTLLDILQCRTPRLTNESTNCKGDGIDPGRCTKDSPHHHHHHHLMVSNTKTTSTTNSHRSEGRLSNISTNDLSLTDDCHRGNRSSSAVELEECNSQNKSLLIVCHNHDEDDSSECESYQ